MHDAVLDTSAELDNAGVTVLNPPAPPLPVTGDKNWIRQVLTGLIQNAIRHARDGGKLSIHCEERNGSACVSVTDNGPGIDPADQARIFERFRQGDSAAKSEGFGIGLALAKWVVEQQNGTITLTSPLPASERLGDAPGTKVTLCIPRAAD